MFWLKCRQNCSCPWGQAETDLLYFRGDVVPLHVVQQCRHIGHTFMLIQLIHLKLHSLILRHNLLTLLTTQTVFIKIVDNFLIPITSAFQKKKKRHLSWDVPESCCSHLKDSESCRRSSELQWKSQTDSSPHWDCCLPCRTERRGIQVHLKKNEDL